MVLSSITCFKLTKFPRHTTDHHNAAFSVLCHPRKHSFGEGDSAHNIQVYDSPGNCQLCGNGSCTLRLSTVVH